MRSYFELTPFRIILWMIPSVAGLAAMLIGGPMFQRMLILMVGLVFAFGFALFKAIQSGDRINILVSSVLLIGFVFCAVNYLNNEMQLF